MGEANVALGVYMNSSDRIRSVLEYYLGEKLPEDWQWEEVKGFYPTRNSKGKLTYRQRDLMGDICIRGMHFLLGLENQDKINLTFPWRLMEMDCLAYVQENKDFFSRIPRSALDVIDVCTNIKDIKEHLEFHTNEESKEEEADMCKALDDIKKNAKKEGLKQGIQQMNRLVQQLLTDGRQEDLIRATTDEVFRKRLLKEYRI